MSSQTYLLCVVFFFVIFKTTLVLSDDLHLQLYQDPVANDHQSTESHTEEQVKTQLMSSPGCPEGCNCMINNTHHGIYVDCSSKGLTMVPNLSETTVELSLMNNSISNITCESFQLLFNLESLNLASNKIKHLPSCVFVSQSSSLLKLKLSDNDIKVLEVKLFHTLSHLETLDLSFNVITHLASKTFSDLVQLVNLNLSFNHIVSIAPDAFNGLHCLKNLSLLNNRLDYNNSFHKDVFHDLGALEMLDVKGNLGRIDEAVSSLKNVSHLHIEVNHNYEVLGTGFRQLTSLRVLNLDMVSFHFKVKWRYKRLSYCYLDTVPSIFFGNINTEKNFELYLSSCHLKMCGHNTFLFPSTLVTLVLRKNMDMQFGRRSVEWVKSLNNTRINYLDLSSTWGDFDLHYISKWRLFRYLVEINLKTLVLKRNTINFIRPQRYFPNTIEKLDLSGNCITLGDLYFTFINSHLNDVKLKELHANNQKLSGRTARQISQQTSDANIFGNFKASNTSLKSAGGAGRWSLPPAVPDSVFLNSSQILHRHFLLGGTMTNSRPVAVTDAKLPKVLNKEQRSNCPRHLEEEDPDVRIVCLPPDLEAIYANSAIMSVDSSVHHIRILNNTVLRHVELADNPLSALLGPVENVPSLQYLDLSRNKFGTLSVHFFKYMVSLQTLILKENCIGPSLAADINGHIFSTLTNLRLLDVSQNCIQDLSSSAFIQNRNLEILNLSNNQLNEFQPTISTILNMSFLDLSHNFLRGLCEQTCEELKVMKSRNKNFIVNILDNRLLLTCEYLPFLCLVLSRPHNVIFYRPEQMQFKSTNGKHFTYKHLTHYFPLLARECFCERFFPVILVVFFILVGTVGFCAVIYHNRWKLRYLYYTSRRRMHIGEHVGDYTPDADVFLTYDQDDMRWRRFMQQTFLPGLNQRNITYILGEIDFPGGDVMAHVAGAVVGTRKTVVLLSMDIFDDHHREFEVNLSIMREMNTRSLKIVPVFVEDVDLALYPREIEIFLRNQWERCLTYSDSDDFWDGFVDAVRENN